MSVHPFVAIIGKSIGVFFLSILGGTFLGFLLSGLIVYLGIDTYTTAIIDGVLYKKILSILALALLMIAPWGYLWVSRGFAIRSGVLYLVKKHKTLLVNYLIDKAFESIMKKKATQDLLSKTEFLNAISKYFVHMNGIPRVFRWMLRYLLSKFPIYDKISTFLKQSNEPNIHVQLLKSELCGYLNAEIDSRYFSVSYTRFYILIGVQALALSIQLLIQYV